MLKATRTHKSFYNSIIAFIYYVIGLVLAFFSRKIFLEYLGTEVLGLNSTLQNILQFLNLTELGIGSAIGFSLYKPFQESDQAAINEIITLQGKLYKRVGTIVIVSGCILMIFLPLIFKKAEIPLYYTYLAFITFLLSSILGYFINYKQILLSASQQNYKILYSYRTCILIKILFQILVVVTLTQGYIWWLIMEIIFSLISSLSLNYITKKTFPNLKETNQKFHYLKIKYKVITIKIKQLFFHKIGGYALTQLTPLIIYAFIDLSEVALYGNYIIIVSGIQMMTSAIFNSMDAGVGNLVAEGETLKIKNIFLELFSIRFIISTTLTFGFFLFAQKFIELWIGSEYLLSNTTILLIGINMYIQLSRYTVETFLNAYGLFSDIWSPIIETLINVFASIILGSYFKLNGIIAGVCISQVIIIGIWKPFYLISRRLNGFIITYIRIYLIYFITCLLVGITCWYGFNTYLLPIINNLISLVIVGILLSLVYFLITITIIYTYSMPMRKVIYRIKEVSKIKIRN